MASQQPDDGQGPQQPPPEVYAALARRLGIGDVAAVEGPARNPLMGPGDEKPIDKLLRLSSQMELIAAEIRTVGSVTYRTQLWQQWAAIWHGRPERQARLADLARVSPAASPLRRTRGVRSRR
ncbi:MAG: hypothetical protein AB7G13_26515 [Lautropia sp.]